MRRALRAKLRIFSGAVILFAVLIIIRLYFVQIVDGGDYALAAERQYEKASGMLYDRGSVYLTRKDGTYLSAAGLLTGFRLAVNPSAIKDSAGVHEALKAHAEFDSEWYEKAVAKTTDPYEVLATRIPEEAGEAIASQKLPGVIVERERWRTYPGGSRAAQSIGFVAYDNDDDLSGRFGLERYYDYVLDRGNEGLFGNFFAELFADLDDAVGDARKASEGDLVTSLEPLVTEKLDEVLQEIQAQYGSAETGGIIMDPKTGEIIAMQSIPSFDPNAFDEADPATFGNPMVENQYEFGSIMKPLTMAAGIDAGVVSPETTYNDTGCVTMNTAKICNYDLKARGVVAMQEVLSQSLNVGASFVATRLGHEKFRSYFSNLGFGEETGIDLPSEAGGNIENILTSPRDIEYATASYGQGIAETPVQMVKALGALANNGMVVTPHLVRAIRLESGVVKTLAWGEPERVFSPESVEDVTQMLVKVVDAKLEGGALSIPEMSVAAKTGTAQVPGPGGKYADGKYFHSFFGYFPAYEPRFIILLYTREPGGVQYASETLTHPFMELTHFLINYYDVAPDRTTPTPEV